MKPARSRKSAVTRSASELARPPAGALLIQAIHHQAMVLDAVKCSRLKHDLTARKRPTRPDQHLGEECRHENVVALSQATIRVREERQERGRRPRRHLLRRQTRSQLRCTVRKLFRHTRQTVKHLRAIELLLRRPNHDDARAGEHHDDRRRGPCHRSEPAAGRTSRTQDNSQASWSDAGTTASGRRADTVSRIKPKFIGTATASNGTTIASSRPSLERRHRARATAALTSGSR